MAGNMRENNGRRYLPTSPTCFACGERNPAGLRLRFYVEDGMVKTTFRVHPDHCGYPKAAHGGIVAAALDECMAWAATRAFGLMCVTAEITVRYLQRTPADRELTICAEVVRAHRRLVSTKAVIVDVEGTVFARAEARFLPLSVEETLRIDDAMIYRGDEERIFDRLRRRDASARDKAV
ncbi:MAG TPA: PaaI family thioesterase [Candidatus Hydrogenedentes bacterium]|nr:PaaI family thioesterase [Candidatus Hydrogenedentota bacterium]